MDDPRPLRLRPQTEEPARAHVSPPTLTSSVSKRTSPAAETATGHPLGTASEGVFAEARAILVREGMRRRKLQRAQRAIVVGSVCGMVAFYVAHFAWRRPIWEMQVANVILPLLNLIGPSYGRASRRQKKALATLVPGAEKSDLSWLIEGTEYADTPELRMALLEKIRGFLADMTPEDAVLLPEGARKILRGWPNGLLRQEPERTRETLRALAMIEDPKLPKLLRGIARWRPRHVGDEETIRLATDALGLPQRVFPTPPATRVEAEKAVAEESELRKRWSQMETTSALFTLLIFLVQFGVALYLGKFAILWFSFGFFLFTLAISILKAQIHDKSLYREAVAEQIVSQLAEGNRSASPNTPLLAGGVARETSGGGLLAGNEGAHPDG